MEGLQGAVLGVKLKHLAHWTEKRREVARKYNEFLKGVEFIDLPAEKPNVKHVYHLYVVQILKGGGEKTKSVRDKLVLDLKEKGIATGLHYPIPLHLQKCFSYLNYNYGDFPISETLSDACLSLPIYPEITDDQIEFVSTNILKFFKNNNQ
jgi:dTDP-4-amino-4,6-dideoxygalactose transaminase